MENKWYDEADLHRHTQRNQGETVTMLRISI